jgi:hypothetical protein
MSEKTTYACKECGKTLDLGSKENIPECCGLPMEKLPYCRNTDTPEQARSSDEGEPCDDGRAG